eukprot:scaffold11198_cov103-Skeletonema_dohrnii-CCMP3373.AAC.7
MPYKYSKKCSMLSRRVGGNLVHDCVRSSNAPDEKVAVVHSNLIGNFAKNPTSVETHWQGSAGSGEPFFISPHKGLIYWKNSSR